MKYTLNLFALAALSLALTGCGWFGGGEKESSSAETTGAGSPADDGGSPIATTGMSDPAPVEIGGDTGPSDLGGSVSNSAAAGERGVPTISTGLVPAENVVYFDFDSTAIASSGLQLVQDFGKFLVDNPAVKVRLEGHADERGTREYNVGLGERRANAVQQALLNAGAGAAQLSVISYGEERALDAAHTEEAWARNRRVELIKP